MEQSSKCKTLVGPLTFIFEHIFDVMCLPIKLLYNIDKFGHKKSNFQIALNAYTFNVNYSLLQVIFFHSYTIEKLTVFV